jgi:hypothetical protein
MFLHRYHRRKFSTLVAVEFFYRKQEKTKFGLRSISFYLKKTYPTTQILLDHLLALHPDFPIASRTSLWRYMKKIGFRFKCTSKVKIPLDNVRFVAQRAHFFRKMDELRGSNAKVFFHDETWTNAGDERQSV